MKIIPEQPKIAPRPNRTTYWLRFYTVALILGFLYSVALATIDLNFRSSQTSIFQMMKRLFWEPFFTEAVISQFPMYMGYMFETLAIAYAGTLMGSILAIPFGFLAARNMTGHVSKLGKGISNGIRAFPEIMFAIIFVAAVGMGPYAGVLAIGINSIGMLSKLYSEVIESIDMTIVEALKASGANKLQTIWYGVIPQIVPEFASYAIYRFEIDVRSSTVLGIVGAGGIGAPLILAANQRNWEAVGLMLIIIIVVVTAIDILSAFIRKRIV